MNAKEMLGVVKTYASTESKCKRTHVGVAMCTGSKDDLTLRYLTHNGPVERNECSNEEGQCGCFHAEIRAIMKVIEKHDIHEHWGIYKWIIICTMTPCTTCANFILQYGEFLNEWYFGEQYRNPRGMNILRDAGIICEKI